MVAIDSYSWQLFRLVCLRAFSNSAYQSLNLFPVTKLELYRVDTKLLIVDLANRILRCHPALKLIDRRHDMAESINVLVSFFENIVN